jgi:hypothetical protein
MEKSRLLLAFALIAASSTQVFAGSSQNGPIGPGSRYGLQPSPDVPGYNSRASIAELDQGNGDVTAGPRLKHRRHIARVTESRIHEK